MRIAHILTRWMRAGSEENTYLNCRAQAAAGHEVIILHGEEYDAAYRDSLDHGIRFIAVPEMKHPLAPLDDIRGVRAMTRLLRELAPDVVHTHQSKAGIVGRLAARRARVPHIIHGVHILPFVNVSPLKRAIYVAAERLVARDTKAFINVSRGMRDECLKAGVGHPDRHFIVHSGFDVGRFQSSAPPSDWRTLLGVAPDAPKPPVLVMLAALETRKRQCEFIRVYGRIVERFPEVRLVLAGEGPARPLVEAAIAESGLSRNICLLGHSPVPDQLIALADICLLTSMREGLPRVVMQYLAGGKPAVVSDIPGLDEILDDGRNGIVTDAEDLSKTADAIIALLENPARLAELSAGALATDLGTWDRDRMCEAIDQVYDKVLG